MEPCWRFSISGERVRGCSSSPDFCRLRALFHCDETSGQVRSESTTAKIAISCEKASFGWLLLLARQTVFQRSRMHKCHAQSSPPLAHAPGELTSTGASRNGVVRYNVIHCVCTSQSAAPPMDLPRSQRHQFGDPYTTLHSLTGSTQRCYSLSRND